MITGIVGSVVLGSVLTVIGAALVLFRVRVASASRTARDKFRMSNPQSQTPALVAVVGTFFALVGIYLIIGTLTGVVHARS